MHANNQPVHAKDNNVSAHFLGRNSFKNLVIVHFGIFELIFILKLFRSSSLLKFYKYGIPAVVMSTIYYYYHIS